MSQSDLSIFLLILLCATPVFGDTFRCKNSEGELVYSDIPCHKSTYEIVEIEETDVSDLEYEDIEKEVESTTKAWFWDMVESIGTFFYRLQAEEPATASSSSSEATIAFECKGKKTCGEMFSCEEATFYFHQCPNVELDDEDGDGIPCENHWCQFK